MNTYTHTLTETEIACGVTLEDVARELPRGVFRNEHVFPHFVVSPECGPALAGSVARAAFAGREVEYMGRTRLGHAYRPVREVA